jgi:hypothetical protein
MSYRRRRPLLLVALLGALAACTAENPNFNPGADLSVSDDLAGADLTGVVEDLAGADLTGVDLAMPDLVGADLVPSPYKLSISDATVTEGDNGAVELVYTVTLSPAAPDPVSFTYATADGTAKVEDGDYLSLRGQLTFPTGETSLELVVPVMGDVRDEDAETLNIVLSAPVGASIDDGTGVGTITDDDDAPSLTIDDTGVYEGQNNGAIAVFRVVLSEPSGRTVTVSYATANGTAGALDYTAKSGALTFLPGETEKLVGVVVANDMANEGPEAFTMSLSGASGAAIGRATATGTVYDDDAGLPVFTVSGQQLNEGDAGEVVMTFTVSTSLPLIAAAKFHAATHALSATSGVDFEPVDMDVNIGVASNAATIEVKILGDVLFEENETFALVLSSPAGATLATPIVVGRINDDDAAPALSYSGEAAPEGDLGSTMLFVPMSLDEPSGRTALLRVSTTQLTADIGGDFAELAGLVRFPPGTTTLEVGVPIHGDLLDEADETFRLRASMAVSVQLSVNQATCVVQDDD